LEHESDDRQTQFRQLGVLVWAKNEAADGVGGYADPQKTMRWVVENGEMAGEKVVKCGQKTMRRPAENDAMGGKNGCAGW